MSSPLPPAIGRYEVRERIGQGGMGALFLALDPAIDRLVALKLLRVDSDEMRARFLREARSVGRLLLRKSGGGWSIAEMADEGAAR